jgi:gamma-glutamylcyclotransferase (GGCT)/AIG2-like uncharacterized protein YtfP
MEIETDKLFVYGSLRRDFHNPAHDYISQYFSYFGEGTVNGILYDLGEYPAAIPTSDKFFIKGELYILKNQNELEYAMEPLDDYEGVNAGEGEIPLYVRKITKVVCDNYYTNAWIYWYNLSLTVQPIMPSEGIFDYLTYKTKQ